MSDYVLAVMESIYSALTSASPQITGGRVYDHVPQDVTFPYVAIGTPDSVPDDTRTDSGIRTAFDLHVYSQYRGQEEALQVMSQIYDVFHGVSLSVTGRTSGLAWVTGQRVLKDPDGLTTHGVVTVEITHR
jgi:hypothetical protein